MDIRLFKPAQTGNIESLHQLVRENAPLLDQVALFSSENLLNIAYTAGQFEFVEEIINLKPDLAKEVNRDGLSLMHMAAVSGHLEIVHELTRDPLFAGSSKELMTWKLPLICQPSKGGQMK